VNTKNIVTELSGVSAKSFTRMDMIMLGICGFKGTNIPIHALTLPADNFMLEGQLIRACQFNDIDLTIDSCEANLEIFANGIKHRPVGVRYGNIDFDDMLLNTYEDYKGLLIPATAQPRDDFDPKGFYNFIWDDRMCSLGDGTYTAALTSLQTMRKGLYFVTYLDKFRVKKHMQNTFEFFGVKSKDEIPGGFQRKLNEDMGNKDIKLCYYSRYSGKGKSGMSVIGFSKGLSVPNKEFDYRQIANVDDLFRKGTAQQVLNGKTKKYTGMNKAKGNWSYNTKPGPAFDK